MAVQRGARQCAAQPGRPLVEVIKADGVTARALRERAPFDLIFANILLAPLQRFAATLTKLTARGGRLVLSGLLRSQANAALAAYPRSGA